MGNLAGRPMKLPGRTALNRGASTPGSPTCLGPLRYPLSYPLRYPLPKLSLKPPLSGLERPSDPGDGFSEAAWACPYLKMLPWGWFLTVCSAGLGRAQQNAPVL